MLQKLLLQRLMLQRLMFRAGNFRTGREGVPAGADPGELLESSEILDHDALLLCRDGLAASLLQQVQDTLAVLALAGMLRVLVRSEVVVVQKLRLAQLAYQGATQQRRA